MARGVPGVDLLSRGPRSGPPEPPRFDLRRVSAARPEVIAIASSTGGPPALMATLRRLGSGPSGGPSGGLRGALHQPILIAQHMPAGFMPLLAAHIARAAGVACREAVDGVPLAGGRIYLAPGDRHLEVRRGDGGALLVHLSDALPVNFCRPSADPLFRSLAAVFGPRLLAVVLTGMGADGQGGAAAVIAAGGTVIAQDRATSVVWGMPRAVAEAGLCAAVLPLAQIAPWIRCLAARPGPCGPASCGPGPSGPAPCGPVPGRPAP